MLKTIAIVAALTTGANAATINWGTASTIAGDADVSTAGSRVYGYTFGDATQAPTSVNGQLFDAFRVTPGSGPVTVGNVTVRETQGPMSPYPFGSSGNAPYANLSAAYRGLLDQIVSSGVTEAIEVTMGGLTVGQLYQVQTWCNVSIDDSTLRVTLDGTRTLDANTADAAGGLGQYAIGTFTADATTQVFTQSGLDGNLFGPFGTLPAVNAFQLRAVPEPTTLAAAAGGVVLTLARRRRRA